VQLVRINPEKNFSGCVAPIRIEHRTEESLAIECIFNLWTAMYLNVVENIFRYFTIHRAHNVN